MSESRKLIPGDLCADCANCCLLFPVGLNDAPALCLRGWPHTHRFHEFISRCPQYEKSEAKQGATS